MCAGVANNNGPRQSRCRAILVFRGVVVGVAKAYEPHDLQGFDSVSLTLQVMLLVVLQETSRALMEASQTVLQL